MYQQGGITRSSVKTDRVFLCQIKLAQQFEN
jgi:hypothetical protein